MRVKNSPLVNPPWVSLIDIFNQPLFNNEFKNMTVKRHAIHRIFEFLLESLNRVPEDIDQQIRHVLL